MFGQSRAREPASFRGHRLRTPAYRELHDLHAIGDRGTLAVAGTSFAIRRCEIVGIAGVSGNGQKELVEILAGQRDAR